MDGGSSIYPFPLSSYLIKVLSICPCHLYEIAHLYPSTKGFQTLLNLVEVPIVTCNCSQWEWV